MLNLFTVPGPVVYEVVPSAVTGTMVPLELFTKKRFRLSLWAL